MKKNQFLILGVTLLCAAVQINAHAKVQTSSDDSAPSHNSACMIPLEGDDTIEMINTQYIRTIYIKKSQPKIVRLELASSYNNRGSFEYAYGNPEDARAQLVNLSNRISKCRDNIGQPELKVSPKLPKQGRW